MSLKSLSGSFALALAFVFAAPAFAAEPSLHDIYTAADAGRLGEAQTMIDQVLRDHPNSARAHYVQAELMVREGQPRKAEAELATAERLAPGLPFAKPEAVRELRAQFSRQAAAPLSGIAAEPLRQNTDVGRSGMPWGMLIGLAALVAFIVAAVRFMARRNAAAPVYAGAYGTPTPAPYAPYGGGVMQPGMGPGAVAPGGGMGSGIMTGLATGAAVGAGMVAGQALMRHFIDADGNRVSVPVTDNTSGLAPSAADYANYDMGGQDFGVADGGSWDDGGGGGGGDAGGDWN